MELHVVHNTGAGRSFEAGKVPADVGMISLCRPMGWSSAAESMWRCSVHSTKLVTFRTTGTGHAARKSERPGCLPLSDGARTCVSGWG